MIKKVRIADLRVGMMVEGLSRDGKQAEKSFSKPRLINSPADIKKIYAIGYRYVYITDPDDIRNARKPKVVKTLGHEVDGESKLELIGGWDLPPEDTDLEDSDLIDAQESVDEFEEPVPEISFKEEIKQAQDVKEEAGDVVRDFMEDARTGKGIETGKAKEVVGGMIDSVFRNQDALLSLARLKNHDNYTFGHCVNVCILALALGRYLGLPKKDLHLIGTGAILHDTGKMLVPSLILNKPDKLTVNEFEEIKKHVTYSKKLLTESGHIDERSVNIAYQHHEKFNGSGYPEGISGDEIDYFGRLVSVVDVYDALTSSRVYEPKNKTPNIAVKMIFSVKGKHFDPAIVDPFVKCLGIYPLGSFVSLSSGETALVKAVNRVNLLRPTVLVMFDIYKIRLKDPYEINLNHIPSIDILSSVISPISEEEITKHIG